MRNLKQSPILTNAAKVISTHLNSWSRARWLRAGAQG